MVVMTGRHDKIELMMQIPGHARCLVDGGFALLKKIYLRSGCDGIDQLEAVVNKSSTTNVAVRFPAWQWLDWQSFLDPVIRSIPGIRKYQYFCLSAQKPGVVVVRKSSDSEETEVQVIRPRAQFPASLPPVLPAGGLSRQRQEYLYKNVRPNVRQSFQNITYPAPATDDNQ